jgi:hypothetical protein
MASYTTSLRLVQPSTGEFPGTWGGQVNTSLTALVDVAVAGTTSITMTAANYTLTNANGVADEAKSMFLVLGGTPGGSYNVIVPTASKLYFVTNSTGAAQTVKTSAGTGISVPNGARMTLRCDGTDVVVAQNYFASLTLGAALPVASGGTGAATFTANNVLLGNGTSAFQVVAPGTNGNVLTSNGTTWVSSSLPAGGLTYIFTTTAVTATDKQGVLTSTAGGAFTVTLPATPSTGAQVVVADAGNAWGTNNLTVGRNGSTIGGLAENLVCDITGASVQLVYDGTTWNIYAQIGGQGGTVVTLTSTQTLTNKTLAFASNTLTDVASLNTAQTFTATKTFSGSSSALAMVLNDAAEVATISATAATGTINYDITTQSVLYYTTNASANWTVNLRASSGTSLNTALSTGQSVTVAFLVAQGSTAYYNNVVQVDGTTSGVTTRWQGAAPVAGNANGIDVYSYTIIKTASATFTVLASQTKFA